MDATKKKTISELLGLYKHTLTDLALWVNRVAPNIRTSKDAAYHNAMNEFLGGIMGLEPVEKTGTPIPKPSDDDHLGRDLWLFLGYSGTTVEDIAEYVSEELAERERTERNSNTQINNMLHALPNDSHGAAEIFARDEHQKAEKASFDMSSFLHNMKSVY